MTDEEIIRQAMSLIGQKKSEKKAASSRENFALARQAKALLPCTCGRVPHYYKCPVYLRETMRRARAKKKAKETE
jgi:hypothetical protein